MSEPKPVAGGRIEPVQKKSSFCPLLGRQIAHKFPEPHTLLYYPGMP
jgi:hypothetical protein